MTSLTSFLPTILQNTPIADEINLSAWATAAQDNGEAVDLYRDYMTGDHPANMTDQMKKMLRIDGANQRTTFNANYMPRVVAAKSNRLNVTGMEAIARSATGEIDRDTSAKTSAWIADLFLSNRFDALQIDVHRAALRDGASFVLVSYDEEMQSPRFTFEQAYDGSSGMLALYTDALSTTPDLAVRIWYSTLEEFADTLNVALYWPDMVQFYQGGAEGDLSLIDEAPWVMRDDSPVGVAAVPFRNRDDRSEIADALPLQDKLNRTMHSMVMVTELTAFPVYFTYGFKVNDGAMTPGKIYDVTDSGGPISKDKMVGTEALGQGDPTPYLEAAGWDVEQIGAITDTPMPQLQGSSTASGEALKERSASLLGAVRERQVSFGNSWEDVVALAHRVQDAYGRPADAAPPYTRLSTVWRDPQIRNDREIVQNANDIRDHVDLRTYLEMVAPVYGWDEAKITQIIEARNRESGERLAQLAGGLPDFGAFDQT